MFCVSVGQLICSVDHFAIFTGSTAATAEPSASLFTRCTGPFHCRARAQNSTKDLPAIVRLLAEPAAKIEHIAQQQRVSTHTVRAIRAREVVEIAERKKQLVSILADVATLGSERMAETIGKAGLRDAAIGTGIAVDKMLALTGQMPAVQIANVIMPSEADREERRQLHDKLDAIAARLQATAPRDDGA